MGESVTEIYFPRPLMYAKNPEGLEELRAYLLKFDKCQVEKENISLYHFLNMHGQEGIFGPE
ncbi:MAG: hypothetical protein ACI8QQ_002845 [Psychroserpens sp.]|jgi:hypothetical protein